MAAVVIGWCVNVTSSWSRSTFICLCIMLRIKSSIAGFKLSDQSQVSKDINAFRTIVTLLSLIQRRQGKAGLPAHIGSKSQQAELKIVSALATVLVMENDVVAVTAKHDHGNLKVFTCAQNDLLASANAASSDVGILKYLKNFVVTINTRRDHPSELNTGPTITDPADYAPDLTNLEITKPDVLEKLSRKEW